MQMWASVSLAVFSLVKCLIYNVLFLLQVSEDFTSVRHVQDVDEEVGST